MLVLLVLVVFSLLRPGKGETDEVWRRIQETGVWQVGMDPSFPPFESLTGDGKMIGFDVDLARAIAVSWGIKVTFHGVGFDSLLDAIMAGRVDSAVSALPVDPRFARDVAYSIPYFEAGLVWVTAAPDVEVKRQEDIAGRQVALEHGSEADAFLRRLQRRVSNVRVVRFSTPDEALRVVSLGKVELALVDAISARQAMAKDTHLRVTGQPVESSPYVIVMPAKAPTLVKEVNQAIELLRENGQLDRLSERWFARD